MLLCSGDQLPANDVFKVCAFVSLLSCRVCLCFGIGRQGCVLPYVAERSSCG